MAIAIVGMGAVLPGAKNLDEFWQNLKAGKSAAREVPPERWSFQPQIGRGPDQVASRVACLLDEPPSVGELALRAGKEAFAQGKTARLDRSRVGVVLAAIALPTRGSSQHSLSVLEDGAGQAEDRSPVSLPAAQLARELGLGGGSYTLDAACASSLYALKFACDELTAGRADAMLAGGLNSADSLYTQIGFTALQALSASGICAPFDQRGDGLVVGEGAGIFLLKRLEDARRDGDKIFGIIRAIGLSNDTGGSLLAPDSEGQLRAMRAAYSEAGWRPSDVDLVECHGTGTPAGDQTELASLLQLWEGEKGSCAIGSVKSSIGHLLTGAGAAGLLKVLLGLQHDTLPPSLNFEKPVLPIENTPLHVLTQAAPWPRRKPDEPRKAAVSGFGFGGVNGHLLLEEDLGQVIPAPIPPDPEAIAIVGIGAHVGSHTHRDAWLRASIKGESSAGRVGEVALAPGRFRVPPRDMPNILPQQLLMLTVAAEAVEDAGIELQGPQPMMGTYIGVSLDPETNNFHHRWVRGADAHPPLDSVRTLGALASIVASRVARELSLGGPSFSLSAEEASGLKAVELAVRALERRELDCALVGAVDLYADPRNLHAHQQLFPGLPAGEGAVAMVLMRLTDAQIEGRKIYAVIRGVGAADTCPRAFERAGAAGFSLFDGPVLPFADRDCAITELPEHLGAVTGLAALARAAGCLHHQLLPAGPRGVGVNEPFEHICREPVYWYRDRIEGPRRAVIAYPTRDKNAVAVMLEGLEQDPPRLYDLPSAIFCFDRHEIPALRARLGEDFQSLARSWRGQPVFACVAASRQALKDALELAEQHLQRHPDVALRGQSGLFYSPTPPVGGEVAFVYPGSGNHYVGMGHELSRAFPEVVHHLDLITDRLASQIMPRYFSPYRGDWSPGWREDARRLIEADPHRMIYGQVAFGILASRVALALGLDPHAVIGYSLGESAGLFSLGAWPERDRMYTRIEASPLFREQLVGRDWKVCVVNRGAAEVREALEDGCFLLIVNTDSECVIGGTAKAVDHTVASLGCESFALSGVPTVHCELMHPVAEDYYDLHVQPVEEVPQRFYSGHWARSYELTSENAASSILEQAEQGLDYPATIRQAYKDGVRVFLEMGPGNSCTRMIDQILASEPHMARSLSGGSEDEVSPLLRLLAACLVERVPGATVEALYARFPAPDPQEPGNAVRVKVGSVPRLVGSRETREQVKSGDGRRETAVVVSNGKQEVQVIPPVAPPQPVMAPAPVLAPPPVVEMPMVAHGSLEQQVLEAAAARASAHDAYLRFSTQNLQGMGEAVQLQTQLLEALLGGGLPSAAPDSLLPTPPISHLPSPISGPPPQFPRELCMEFAIGSIAKVLGPAYAEADNYPTRVRLPDEPLMLVDRIMLVEGEPLTLKSGRVVTEHDVLPGAWYLDCGRTPVCVSVEAGQADLFLSAYLGIDLATKGLRVYRLLDAEVVFHRGLPRVGETIRYDIRIDRFVRQGDSYLFFFNFEGTIDGEPLISMSKGCAGFFTYEEIDANRGILEAGNLPPDPRQFPAGWSFPTPFTRKESYSDAQIEALRNGDLGGCFGPAFANLGLQNPSRLPKAPMNLLHRVLETDPTGGRFGLGKVTAEADIHPDDWFLTCHFVDDMVMPGTLMYECCAHTLRFHLLRMGWVCEADEVAYEPIIGQPAVLRCRGPVLARTKKVIYEVEISEIGYRPEPYVKADALMYADGKPIVRFTGMSMQLTGMTRQKIESRWKPLYDAESILQFSIGDPSKAFGDRYKVFDKERRIARLPGPPFLFMHRVVEVNQEPWVLKPGGWIESQYDVPPDAWYFGANHQPTMPFCVLLEAALQPCGWLAAYAGSALRSSNDMHFRNLGGTATLHQELWPDIGTIRVRVKMTNVSEAGGMIIEDFAMQVLKGDTMLYEGTTNFGFFSSQALANQLGVRDAKRFPAEAQEVTFDLPRLEPMTPDDASDGTLGLPGKALFMMDEVDCWLPEGGPHGLGFIRGVKTVDPTEWFFKAHFYQDPVWPGSLGLEAFLQLLRIVAWERWPELRDTHRVEAITVGAPHTWIYRGQVIPTNKRVEVECAITRIEGTTLTAEGFLVVDGLPIYEMKDFGITLQPLT